MPKNPLKLKIAYLLPDLLQSYCDEANIATFVQRAKWRDIDVQVQYIQEHESINASKFDFYYIGGSNTSNLSQAIKALEKNKDELYTAAGLNIPMLAVYCGYILFGNFYQLHNRAKVECLKIFNMGSLSLKEYIQGNVIGTCPFLRNKTIVGYKNHPIQTFLDEDVNGFITLKKGIGNNIKNKITEGAKINNVIGTYITSSILAQNPHLCDYLIVTALKLKYKCKITLSPLCDDAEWFSHNYIIENC